MASRSIDKVSLSYDGLIDERAEVLRELFPEAFTEGRIDFEQLRATLGYAVDDRRERYSFTWAGRQDALRAIQSPTWGTLVPNRERSVNFDETPHVFIEGDNLEVLKLLSKSYYGRVKMIYIDPPYNTGNEFVYSDNFTDPKDAYLRLTGQVGDNGQLLTSNPETSGRYHSNWLTMMYPRLVLARRLLRDDGVIFVSIDDHEVYHLRLLMNELFGEENFIATVIWRKVYSPKSTAKHFSEDHDYILVYARNGDEWRPRLLPRTEAMEGRYRNPDNDARGPWKPGGLDARNYYSQGQYSITTPSGRIISGPPPGAYWRVSPARLKELDQDGRIWWGEDGNNVPAIKRFLSEVQQGRVPQTLWSYQEVGHTQEAKQELIDHVKFEHTENVINTVKPTRLIQRMLQIATDPVNGDIVLDFFAGSAATAHAVLAQNQVDGGNRRAVSIQLPEPLPIPETRLQTIADIGTERIRSVSARIEAEKAGSLRIDPNVSPTGFRLYQLGESHWNQWPGLQPDTDAATYVRALELFQDPLVGSWTPASVICEVLLREGLELSAAVTHVDGLPADAEVWRVIDDTLDQSFYICLDGRFDLESARALNLAKDDLLIVRDVALDDTTAANLALQCRLKVI